MPEDDWPFAGEARKSAFAVAYRMLGSVAEAEDVVQETLLRVHGASERGERIESPRAYAGTVAARLALDVLRSARVRRESYQGEWLPEPVVSDPGQDPQQHAEMADSLSLAFLVLLESLSPEQRAALLLHDVFGYGYDEVARIVGKSEDNARQLAARARRHVSERRPRFQSSREQRDELARRFFAAAQEGDLAGLETLLAHGVTLHGDGGGKVPALARSLHGRSRVARTLLAWMRAGARIPGASMRQVEVNGQQGAVMLDGESRVISVMALDVGDDEIVAVRSIVNPEKLGHLGPVADLRELLRPREV
ncbi:MAG TPA: RNA polymerase sigma-70 factor [Thermoleophilaceae bacterium]|nr:RNA polymerase sigma-70 factor [Thermoleophilaceae bacterium]